MAILWCEVLPHFSLIWISFIIHKGLYIKKMSYLLMFYDSTLSWEKYSNVFEIARWRNNNYLSSQLFFSLASSCLVIWFISQLMLEILIRQLFLLLLLLVLIQTTLVIKEIQVLRTFKQVVWFLNQVLFSHKVFMHIRQRWDQVRKNKKIGIYIRC